MEKRSIIVLSIGLVALVAGVLVYAGVFRIDRPDLHPLDAVPSEAAVVLEVRVPSRFQATLDSSGHADDVRASNWWSAMQTTGPGLLDTLFGQAWRPPLYTAFVHAGSGSWGAVHILRAPEDLVIDPVSMGGFEVSRYSFQDQVVYELQRGDQGLAVAIASGLMIVSERAGAVESGLLSLSDATTSPVVQAIRATTDPADQAVATVHVHHEALAALWPVLFMPSTLPDLGTAGDLATVSRFDLVADGRGWRWTGHATAEEDDILVNWRDQAPARVAHPSVLPHNTALVHVRAADSVDALLDRGAYDASFYHPWLDGEWGYFVLECLDVDMAARTGFFARVTDTATVVSNLRSLGWARDSATGLATFTDSAFATVFPADLLAVRGAMYATFIDDFLVVSPQAAVVQTCIQKRGEGATLRSDLAFLEHGDGLPEQYNVGIYLDAARMRLALDHRARGGALLPASVGRVSMRWSAVGDRFLTAGRIAPARTSSTELESLWSVDGLIGPEALVAPVTNHNSGSVELLVQSIDHRLSLINQVGEVLFTHPLDGPVVGPVHQIDFYDNRKLQYALTTPTHLHVIDRLGRPVADFPLQLPDSAVSPLAVVRYEKAGKLRFFIACANGQLYGYEHTGKPLTGWSPWGTPGRVEHAVRHAFHAADGKDYLWFVDAAGRPRILDRRGQERVAVDDTLPPLATAVRFRPVGEAPRWVAGAAGTLFEFDANGVVARTAGADSSFALVDVVTTEEVDEIHVWANDSSLLWVDGRTGRELARFSTPDSLIYGQAWTDGSAHYTAWSGGLGYVLDRTGTPVAGSPYPSVRPPVVVDLFRTGRPVVIVVDGDGWTCVKPSSGLWQ